METRPVPKTPNILITPRAIYRSGNNISLITSTGKNQAPFHVIPSKYPNGSGLQAEVKQSFLDVFRARFKPNV
jgi:hypothetical protein